jgi:hypothetical protein
MNYCWGGGPATADDPKTAFFNINLPNGITEMTTGTTDWDKTYKIYADPRGIGELDNVLSWWGSNSPDGTCLPALGSPWQQCSNPAQNAPREIVLRNGDFLRSGWLAVSNAGAGDNINYELNVLRVPRSFLGLAQFFVGPGDGLGCCCTPPASTEQEFNLVGYRLDLIPTNDDVGGYAVRKSYVGNSFLVNGGPPYCHGEDCAAPGDPTPMDIGFQFPYGGELYSKFCIDAAGRVILAKDDGDCQNTYDPHPNSMEFLESGGPSLAILWGSIAPCRTNRYSSCGFLGWNNEEALDCLAGPCLFGLGSCEVWVWDETECHTKGVIRQKFVDFEGTTARVITWDGFDGYANPVNQGNNFTLEFQLILRVDGRLTFFYKLPRGGASVWEDALNANFWMVGISGGRSTWCDSDAHCNSVYETTGLSCDTGADIVQGGVTVWERKDRCMNRVNFQQAGAEPVSGTWIEE